MTTMFRSSLVALLLCHFLLEVTCLDSETCEAVIPTSTTSKLGDKAVLKCRLSSPDISWTFCPRNGGPRQIASDCNLLQSASSSYSLDKSSSSCNLVINNVTTDQLGSYTCQDLSLNDTGHTVQLSNTEENLALNKKTIQSSTYVGTNGIAYTSDFAIDKDLVRGSFTNNIAPAWWAIDFERETSVGRIAILNRADSFAARLQQFFIAMTNLSPWTTPPRLNDSSVCTYYTGMPAPGIFVDIFCNPNTKAGRYMFIWMNRAEYLNLPEVQAYYN